MTDEIVGHIDTISRQAAIDAIFAECSGVKLDIDFAKVLLLQRAIKELPPVASPQEPKTGYWRPIYQGDEIINYRCTECEFGNTFGKSTYGMNYCPRCGSKNELLPQESEEKGGKRCLK